MPIAVEFILLCGMLQVYCGTPYLANMLITLGLYTYYTRTFSIDRRKHIRDRKNADKKSEFYLNESIMNYETVKTFNNEKLEETRYSNLIEKVRSNAMIV